MLVDCEDPGCGYTSGWGDSPAAGSALSAGDCCPTSGSTGSDTSLLPLAGVCAAVSDSVDMHVRLCG